jgi:hypothetical protein
MSTLDAQAELADIRLRVLNRERVPPEEFRKLLLNLTRARDGAARAAKSATAAKSRENKKSAKVSLGLTDLFPQVSKD